MLRANFPGRKNTRRKKAADSLATSIANNVKVVSKKNPELRPFTESELAQLKSHHARLSSRITNN